MTALVHKNTGELAREEREEQDLRGCCFLAGGQHRRMNEQEGRRMTPRRVPGKFFERLTVETL